MKISKTIYFIILIFAISQTSCLKSVGDVENNEAEVISDFLYSNPQVAFELKESGLYYYEKTTGTGTSAATNSKAYVFYTLQFLDGSLVESNWDTTDTLIFTLGVDNMIPGFAEGISYMKEGGESVLIVPSSLAYGSDGNSYNIPAYTPLLFGVKLLKVKASE